MSNIKDIKNIMHSIRTNMHIEDGNDKCVTIELKLVDNIHTVCFSEKMYLELKNVYKNDKFEVCEKQSGEGLSFVWIVYDSRYSIVECNGDIVKMNTICE